MDGDYINLIIEYHAQIEPVMKEHIEFTKKYFEKHHGIIDKHYIVFSILKRSLDILDTFLYTTKHNIINIQMPLIRMQLDNCIIIETLMSQYEKGIDISLEGWKDNFHLSNFKDFNNVKLSESKVSKLISKKYKGFYELYKKTSEFIHFTNNSAATLISTRDGKEIRFSVEVGNNNRLSDGATNFKEMIKLSKYLLKEINSVTEKISGTLIKVNM